MTGRGAWRIIVVIAVVVAPLAIHAAIMNASGPSLIPVVAGLQLVVLAALAAARFPAWIKWLLPAAAVLLAALWWGYGAGLNLKAMPGVPHALGYAAFLVAFGVSLMPGHEAILTRMATSIRGPLPPDLHAYTRRVTAAWCCFFALQILLSLGLYAWAPLRVWSFFINVLNLPLVVLMFAGEYGYRVIRYRQYRHDSLSDMINMFAKTGRNGSRQAGSV